MRRVLDDNRQRLIRAHPLPAPADAGLPLWSSCKAEMNQLNRCLKQLISHRPTGEMPVGAENVLREMLGSR